MIVTIIIALLFLIWIIWQLMRAKHFTRFKKYIAEDLKPKVINHIINEMVETRSELFPNNESHQQATIYYWTASNARILQAALAREIITQDWLKKTGNYRNCQHLFYIEQERI